MRWGIWEEGGLKEVQIRIVRVIGMGERVIRRPLENCCKGITEIAPIGFHHVGSISLRYVEQRPSPNQRLRETIFNS